MLYQIFNHARVAALIPGFLFCAQDASMARRGLDHDAVTAATAVVAGRYRGEYKGAMGSGTLNLRLEAGAGGWKCEVAFMVQGEEVSSTMRQCNVDQAKIEAVYDFTTQGFALRSHTTGEWKGNGFEGRYRTTTRDESADIDQGTWSVMRAE
jgi:hypothetical protein